MVFFCYFFIIVNIMIVTFSVPVRRVRFLPCPAHKYTVRKDYLSKCDAFMLFIHFEMPLFITF